MSPTNLPGRQLTPRNQHAWRRWLAANHGAVSEVWVVFYKKTVRRTGLPTLTYEQSVEQAICFGWIDGIKRRIDDERYAHRFTPRKPDSWWSASNRARLEGMRSQGLMTPAGEEAVEASIRSGAWATPARAVAVETPPELLAALDQDPRACAGWLTLTRAQQRRYEVWIGMAKRDETRTRRLTESLDLLRRGKKLGMR